MSASVVSLHFCVAYVPQACSAPFSQASRAPRFPHALWGEMMDTSIPVGFTFGELGTVRDRQTALIERTHLGNRHTVPSLQSTEDVFRIGEYEVSYAPLSPDDLIDPEVDEEIAAMLAASTVVRRNERA
jgi:hypothetical protein